MEPTKLSQTLTRPTQRPGENLRLWQLWLDGQPISIREHCIEAIDKAQKGIQLLQKVDILGNDKTLLGLIGLPARGSLTAHIFDNIRNEANRISLLIWAVFVSRGKVPLVGWNTKVGWHAQIDNTAFLGTSEADRHETLGNLFTRALDAPRKWARTAPPRSWMSLAALRQVLVEATEAEWQQAREDWRTIADAIWAWGRMVAIYKLCEQKIKNGTLPRTASRRDIEALERAVKLAPLETVIRVYRQPFVRAGATSFIIRARRSKLKGNVEQIMASLRSMVSSVEAVNKEAEELLQSA